MSSPVPGRANRDEGRARLNFSPSGRCGALVDHVHATAPFGNGPGVAAVLAREDAKEQA